METKQTPKIEKGIPLPTQRANGLSAAFRTMHVGDSVFLAGKASSSNVSPLYGYVARLTKRKFSARKVDGGVRVWRIA